MWTIRPEIPEDIDAIRAVERAAFETDDEARLVDALREAGALTISLVAEADVGHIVGHVAFSPVRVTGKNEPWDALALGPMAVAPGYQQQGVGSALMETGLGACREIGQFVVFLIGHPWFYPRFGFEPAGPRGFSCNYDVPENVFMVAELIPDALHGRSGHVHYHPAFSDIGV